MTALSREPDCQTFRVRKKQLCTLRDREGSPLLSASERSGPFTALIPGCVEGPLCLLLSPTNTPAKIFSKPPIGHRRAQTGISAEIDLGILLGTLPLLLKGVRSCSISLLALFLPESAKTQTTQRFIGPGQAVSQRDGDGRLSFQHPAWGYMEPSLWSPLRTRPLLHPRLNSPCNLMTLTNS